MNSWCAIVVDQIHFHPPISWQRPLNLWKRVGIPPDPWFDDGEDQGVVGKEILSVVKHLSNEFEVLKDVLNVQQSVDGWIERRAKGACWSSTGVDPVSSSATGWLITAGEAIAVVGVGWGIDYGEWQNCHWVGWERVVCFYKVP